MALSAKTVRMQLALLKPLLESCSLKTARKGQDMLGEMMEMKLREKVVIKEHLFNNFRSAWVIPRETRRQGAIFYLHGGGYTCGGLDYALGFGSQLAVQCGVTVFCAAYRLAPENPYPAALEDALESYRYLLGKGYAPQRICLCGESAGGGLCYSLCLRLKSEGLPLPGSIVALSPWTDLTASGDSYNTNREKDPSITKQRLRYFADNYCTDPTNPYVSPLFGDMKGMPPSLIFVGGDEIMLSDSTLLHEKLTTAGVISRLVIKPDRWHGYLLYGLTEDALDFGTINRFLNRYLSEENKLRWLKLDNAAKIYPAARRQNWSNVFRLSVTLNEPVDSAVLQAALDVTVRRFPSIAARLRRGVFWYYLQQLEHAPIVRSDSSYPLTAMSRSEARSCAFRVLVYENRIAVELFHSLTDGTGALIFLKSLTAEYLQQRYGVHIPAGFGVLGRLEEPNRQELEDSFQKYGGTLHASRKGNDAWRLSGTPEPDGFQHLTCLQLQAKQVLDKAHEYGISVTTFLCASVMMALQQLQSQRVPYQLWRKSIKVLLPVNLRRLFPSRTLRNFALYTTPEIQPKLGPYSFQEICQVVHHRMGLELTPKFMSTLIATNVNSERMLAIRLIPLFVKNIVMKMVFNSVGERKSCLTVSNLGVVDLPEEMKPYVDRFDFILGVQASAPYNCGVISYGDTLYMNFIRNIREPALESQLYQVFRDLGLSVLVQSNRQSITNF